MPQNHDAVAALPLATNTNKTLLRDLLEQRVAYVVDDAAMAADLVATDPSTGTTVLVITCLGRNYLYDSTDTTSVHDGVSVLVTSDGKRYKLAEGTDVVVYSVLDRINTPPTDSPGGLMGDAYLITSGATGAWSGHSDDIAVYTLHAWEFVTPEIGQLIYVEDEDAYYRKKADGTIAQGFGINAITSEGIVPSQIQGTGGRVLWIVENQTTNAPPTETDGTAYIIGPSPSGVWSGKAGQIANGEAGDWSYYVPTEGWLAYDKALDNPYRFNGSTWITAGGNMQMNRTVFAANSTFSKDARCVFVDVMVTGGVGGADNGAAAGNGGTSSFGAHCSATGSTANNGSGSTIGSGSGGDVNAPGSPALNRSLTLDVSGTPTAITFSSPGHQATPNGGIRWGTTQNSLNSSLSSAGPGMSIKRILAASLSVSETVTVGAAGSGGGGVAGIQGLVVVEEWVLI